MADPRTATPIRYRNEAELGTVGSISASTGVTLTPNPIIATGTVALSDTAVTPGAYGDATNIPQLTVDQQGRITAAANVPVSVVSNSVQVVELPASVSITGAVAANTDTDVTGLSLTLADPGTYRLEYFLNVATLNAFARVKITDSSNVLVPLSVSMHGTGTGSGDHDCVSRAVVVTVGGPTTYKVRAAWAANGAGSIVIIHSNSIIAGFTNPDNSSVFMATRLY